MPGAEAVGSAGFDDAHQDVAYCRPVLGTKEQGVFAMQHDALERPLDGLGIEGRVALGKKLGQTLPRPL
jgi:hypothetical protein